MTYRISPWAWPAVAAVSPVLAPFLLVHQLRFAGNRPKIERANAERLAAAVPLDLPVLDRLELVVLSEYRHRAGFLGEAGVSYLFDAGRGALLFDVGFGSDSGVLAHNASELGITVDGIEALAISHLHADHMGGMRAARKRKVGLPPELGVPSGKPCFVPDACQGDGFSAHVVTGPSLLTGGLGTTGPLARNLFFFGWTEEQALLARLRDRGLVLITGCGHPSIQLLLAMTRRLSNEPLHAFIGGLHFPVSGGRLRRFGVDAQTLLGTGKPPWQRVTDEDLTQAISALKEAAPRRVLLSAHDSCDHAVERIANELAAKVEVLEAGGRYWLD